MKRRHPYLAPTATSYPNPAMPALYRFLVLIWLYTELNSEFSGWPSAVGRRIVRNKCAYVCLREGGRERESKCRPSFLLIERINSCNFRWVTCTADIAVAD